MEVIDCEVVIVLFGSLFLTNYQVVFEELLQFFFVRDQDDLVRRYGKNVVGLQRCLWCNLHWIDAMSK